MKFRIDADMLRNQLNVLQAERYIALVERMELNEEKLTDAEKESLCYMSCNHDDIYFIKETEKKDLFEEFILCKRMEGDDVWWLPYWKYHYGKAPDENTQNILLQMAVDGLINVEWRYSVGGGHYYNARHSVSEIHKDYAMVLGVDVEKVSSVVSKLEECGRIRKIQDYVWQYADPNRDGFDDGDLVDGVVYVPCAVYLDKAHNVAYSIRRLQNG